MNPLLQEHRAHLRARMLERMAIALLDGATYWLIASTYAILGGCLVAMAIGGAE